MLGEFTHFQFCLCDDPDRLDLVIRNDLRRRVDLIVLCIRGKRDENTEKNEKT